MFHLPPPHLENFFPKNAAPWALPAIAPAPRRRGPHTGSRWLGLALLLLLLTGLGGCRDHRETIPDEVATLLGLEIERPLQVALAAPQGATASAAEVESVTVVFNQPMKELSASSAEERRPFSITPEVSGRFRWKGAATVSFEPSKPLPGATEYRVVVPAGLASPAGKELAEEYSFTFETPRPRALRSLPHSGQTDWPGTAPMVLQLNQPVEPEILKKYLELKSAGGDRIEIIEVRAAGEDQASIWSQVPGQSEGSQTLSFDPGSTYLVEAAPLAPKTGYSLLIKPGLTGTQGALPSEEEEAISFTSLGPLSLQEDTNEVMDPDDSVTVRFSTRVNAAEFKKHLSVEPAVEIPSADYDQYDDLENQFLYLALEPNTDYSFTISGELQDIYGQQLGEDVTFTRRTGDRSLVMVLPNGIGVLEAKGDPVLPVGLRNAQKVTYRMVNLSPETVLKLMGDDSREWLWGSKPYSPEGGFTDSATLEPKGPKNEMYDWPLSIEKVLDPSGTGFVYLQVEAVDASGKQTESRRALIQVTDLAGTAKFGDSESLIVASSLSTASPMSGVKVSLFDRLGRPLWSGQTGSDGTVKAPSRSDLLPAGAERWDNPLTVLLENGTDRTFVEYNSFGEVWAGRYDIPFRWNDAPHQIVGSLYTDRGLYTPGDEVHLRGALRDRSQDRWNVPELDELTYQVFDSRDKEQSSGEVAISDFGTFHHTLNLPAEAPAGSYRVVYQISDESASKLNLGRAIASLAFRVEEFEPAQFEVELNSPVEHPVAGETLPFVVNARWLFGAPMADQPLEWSARLVPSTFESREHPGFEFGPLGFDNGTEPNGDDPVLLHQDEEATTDAQGSWSGAIDTAGMPYRGDATLVLEATAQSESRRSVTGRLALPLARGEFRLGAKPSTRFHTGEDPMKVSLVTISPGGGAVSGQKVTLELIRRSWNSVRKTDVDGRYRWFSETVDEVESSRTMTTRRDEQELELSPSQAGYYVVRLSALDFRGNEVLTETSFYSAGSDYVAWARNDQNTFAMRPDKVRYSPGETAKVLLESPFEEATAVITYERDTILHTEVRRLKGSTPTLEIPIDGEYLPNFYLSVMLFRGRIEPAQPDPMEDLGKPAFALSYLQIPVSAESRRLKVSLTSDREVYGPGQEVKLELRAEDADGKPVEAEFSVAAVDLGVLNLIDYQTPDLFQDFYTDLPLAVRTYDSRIHVIGQRSYGTKGENRGGGGGFFPEVRSDFRLTPLWEPALRTDDQGKASASFRLPDSLTSFRVMATGLTKDTLCGSAELEVSSSQPLALLPATPSFVRLGDSLEAGVTVVNTSGEKGSVEVSLTPNGYGLQAPESKVIFLRDGEQREVRFPLSLPAEGFAAGRLPLQFQARMDDLQDTLAVEFDVVEPGVETTLAHSGRLQADGPKTVEIPLVVPDSAVPGSAALEFTVSQTLLGGLAPALQSLLQYPHDCLEQRLARLEPLLSRQLLARRLGLDKSEETALQEQAQRELDALGSYSDPSGGLKIWPNSERVHPYLTARASTLAKQAKKQGFRVEAGWTSAAEDYLKGFITGKSGPSLPLSEPEVLASRAAALEALATTGFPIASYLNSSLAKPEGLEVLALAHLLDAARIADQPKAVEALTQLLKNRVQLEGATAHFPQTEESLPWLYADPVVVTARALKALVSSAPDTPLGPPLTTWLSEARSEDGDWSNTAQKAAAWSALAAYSEKVEEGSDSSAQAVLTVANEQVFESALEPKAAPQQTYRQPLETAGSTPVTVGREGEGTLYYRLSLNYRDREYGPARDEGMTVLRTITDLSGSPVQRLRGGELYRVQLSVIAPAERRFVVLEDPLPAGLVAVQPDFATEAQKLKDLLTRSNSDRSPGWTFEHFELGAQRVLLFADKLSAGEHLYEYLVRAQTAGTYAHPPAQAWEMYHRELFGRSGAGRIEIRP